MPRLLRKLANFSPPSFPKSNKHPEFEVHATWDRQQLLTFQQIWYTVNVRKIFHFHSATNNWKTKRISFWRNDRAQSVTEIII